MSWIRNLTNTYANLDEENQKEPTLDEASKFKSSFEQRATAHKLATQLSHEINNIALPDPDSVRYEFPSRNYKKEEAQSVKRMDKLISQLEALSKLVSKSGSKF